jgi:hypothetical protein
MTVYKLTVLKQIEWGDNNNYICVVVATGEFTIHSRGGGGGPQNKKKKKKYSKKNKKFKF